MADAAARGSGAKLLHCFGDSHATVFDQVARRRLLARTWIDVEVIGGATALGLANPNSRTRAGVVASAYRNPNPRDHHLAPAPFASLPPGSCASSGSSRRGRAYRPGARRRNRYLPAHG